MDGRRIDSHSARFSGTFANGAVDFEVRTDQGSDTNLICMAMSETLKEVGLKAKGTKLIPPHKFSVVGDSDRVCHWKVVAGIYLLIPHGTALVLRNVIWRVTEDSGSNVIIERPRLESLGIKNRNILEAARDEHDRVADGKNESRKYRKCIRKYIITSNGCYLP